MLNFVRLYHLLDIYNWLFLNIFSGEILHRDIVSVKDLVIIIYSFYTKYTSSIPIEKGT